jgi:hypothetical protein
MDFPQNIDYEYNSEVLKKIIAVYFLKKVNKQTFGIYIILIAR